MKTINILSLFDGISACQVALKNLGIEYNYYASEIDPYAIKVTQGNFPNTIQLGNVKDIAFSEMEIFDKFLMLKKRKKILSNNMTPTGLLCIILGFVLMVVIIMNNLKKIYIN